MTRAARLDVLPLSLPPRGLSRTEAAAYIGVSPSLFDTMVSDRRMPRPKRINARTVWDRLKLDDAFADLPDDRGDDTPKADVRGEYRHMRHDAKMPRRLPKFCVEDVDRYGTVRVYLRRKGQKKAKIEGVPWTEPFMAAYEAALAGSVAEHARDPRRTTSDTWKWLGQQYVGSAAFRRLDAVTQRRRRSLLEATYDEPTRPGATAVFGDFPIGRLTPMAIRILRDRKADKPEGANGRLKAIRAVFKWAMLPDVDLATHNPSRDVPFISTASEGSHTWTIAEVRQFIERHPKGSKAYLALCLLLFAGGRRSDAVAFGRQHIQGTWLRYTQHKGRNSKPMTLEVPMLPVLRAAIEACPSGNLTFLVTEFGKPFTSNGFGNWFRDRCREAGLKHCSAHGLRKAGATIAAENGATERQLMAMFGWRTSKMAEHYTRQAEQKRLADGAMHLIDFERDTVQLFEENDALMDNSPKKTAISVG